MTTLLPLDSDNNPIPALRLKDSGAHSISVSGTSARNSTAFSADTKVVSIYATGPVYLAFGDSSVAATTSDHYFPEGVYYDVAISGGAGKGAHDTHVAALQADSACTLFISEKE